MYKKYYTITTKTGQIKHTVFILLYVLKANIFTHGLKLLVFVKMFEVIVGFIYFMNFLVSTSLKVKNKSRL